MRRERLSKKTENIGVYFVESKSDDNKYLEEKRNEKMA